ncbi:MAG: hypothetical protein ACOC7S_02680 [Planctomycetota bacterium]
MKWTARTRLLAEGAAHKNDRQAQMNGKLALVERIARLALEQTDKLRHCFHD